MIERFYQNLKVFIFCRGMTVEEDSLPPVNPIQVSNPKTGQKQTSSTSNTRASKLTTTADVNAVVTESELTDQKTSKVRPEIPVPDYDSDPVSSFAKSILSSIFKF